MFIYLKEPDVPSSGSQKNSIKLVRSWERPGYGFKSAKGLQDHLKLYQKMKYYNKHELCAVISSKLVGEKSFSG